MTTTTKNIRPRRVDFHLHNEDFECAYLGALGRSSKSINSRTKLSMGQISYRLRKAQIRRMDYRDGSSEVAQLVENSFRKVVTNYLNDHLP